MQDFITNQREGIADLCRKHHVTRLAVFGSAARDVDFDPERSDVDVLVNFDPVVFAKYLDHYIALRDGLEGLFSRRVDLIREGVIKNPYRLRSINHDQVEVYAA